MKLICSVLLCFLGMVTTESVGPLTEYVHAPGKFIAPIPVNSLKIERNISLELCAAKCTLYFRMQQFPCYAFEYTAGSKMCVFTNTTTLMVKNGYLGLHENAGVDYYERSKASYKNLFREIPNSALQQQNTYYTIKLNSTKEECAHDCLLSHMQTCMSFSFSARSGTCGLSNVFWTEGNTNGVSLMNTKVYDHYQYFTAWPCNATMPSNYAPRALASPKFPYLSVTNMECSITLEAPKGNIIRIIIPMFYSTKAVCNSRNEGLTIYDGTSTNSMILGKTCDGNSHSMPLINSSSNVMHIRFRAGETPIAYKALYDFVAQRTDPCTGHLCKNSGKCVALSDQRYSCECISGYSGRFCEANVDDCAQQPCFFNVKCIDKINDYECMCPPGFTGKNCEHFVGACADNPCAHGQCNVTGRNDYVCKCDPGFTGKTCNMRNVCSSGPCVHGECVNTPDSYLCNCFSNYRGKNCDEMIFDVCSLHPCMNGQCTSMNMQFTCSCDPGFTGRLCNTAIDHCQGQNCNRGTCVNGNDTYRCLCDPSFTGLHCETDISLCGGFDCVNGQCINETNGYICVCNSGYIGTSCNLTGDHCHKNPCVHGKCLDSPPGYTCSCDPGYTGRVCSEVMDYCLIADCGYGLCENTQNGYRCICAKGFQGRHCNETTRTTALPVSVCHNHQCQHGGVCRSLGQGYTCECTGTYFGRFCETSTASCNKHPCFGNSTCIPIGLKYFCLCPPTYTGNHCEIHQNACASDPCQFGSCEESSTGYSADVEKIKTI